jgi:hypothetical protein
MGFRIADLKDNHPVSRNDRADLGYGISDCGFERQPPRPSATPPDQEGSLKPITPALSRFFIDL